MIFASKNMESKFPDLTSAINLVFEKVNKFGKVNSDTKQITPVYE